MKNYNLSNGYIVHLTYSHYSNNNNLYLGLETDEGEPYCNLSVNICEMPEKNWFAVDTNHCEWAPEFLIENNLAVFTGKGVRSGYCEYPIFAFIGEE